MSERNNFDLEAIAAARLMVAELDAAQRLRVRDEARLDHALLLEKVEGLAPGTITLLRQVAAGAGDDAEPSARQSGDPADSDQPAVRPDRSHHSAVLRLLAESAGDGEAEHGYSEGQSRAEHHSAPAKDPHHPSGHSCCCACDDRQRVSGTHRLSGLAILTLGAALGAALMMARGGRS